MQKQRLQGVLMRVLFFATLLHPLVASADPATYNETIVLPAAVGDSVKNVAAETAQVLEKITGKPFTVKTEATGPAIVLKYTADSSAGVIAQLKDAGPEAYIIKSYEDRIYITANADSGLYYGLYYYLDQLGVRWYFPTERWTIVPKRTDIRLKTEQFRKPAFRLRTYFGTGGFGRAGVNRFYDLQDKVPTQFAAWQTHNGFGGEFSIGGHAGEDFNLRNKAVLLQHPEYFAEVNGVRTKYDLGDGKVNLGAKHDVSNPGLVELFIQDRLRRFEELKRTNPNMFAISVEPADSGGYANSGEATKIGNGSSSDQTFYLANQVAKAMQQKNPGRFVSLLAYGFNTMPPSFDLEPNVYVTVVPYGFNYSGLDGDELLALWSKKTKNVGVYDYWALPDWARGMPNFNYLYFPQTRIRTWKKLGAQSAFFESSYSSGAIGIALYVTSRLMWDPQADVNAILKDFYSQAFGPAEKPMKRMLERWTGSFLPTAHELGLSYRDMREARTLAAGNEAVMARLDDYAGYLHYLRLYYEYKYDASKSSSPNRRPAAYIEWMWRIYDTTMVEPFRLTSLITLRREDPESVTLFGDKNGEGWKNIKPATHEEIEALLRDGEEKYKPLDFEMKGYGGKYVHLPKELAINANGGKPVTIFFFDPVNFELLVPAGMTSTELTVSVGAVYPMPIKLYDSEGNKLSEQVVPPLSGVKVPLNFPKPGRYVLKASGAKVLYAIDIPPGLGFTVPYFLNSQGRAAPRMYFYVPKGSKTVAIYLTYFMVPKFYDSTGKEQIPRIKNAPGICVVDVPPGQDGKVWSFGDLKIPQPMRLLNVPSALATSPDQLLVPEDALKPPQD